MKRAVVFLFFIIPLIMVSPWTEKTTVKGVSVDTNTIYIYKGQNLTRELTLFPENTTYYQINFSTNSPSVSVYPDTVEIEVSNQTVVKYWLYTNESYARLTLTISIRENYTNGTGNVIQKFYVFNIPLVVGDAYRVSVTTLSTVLHVPVSKRVKCVVLETNYTVPVIVKETPAVYYIPEGLYRFEATDGSGGVQVYINQNTEISILVYSWLDYIVLAIAILLLVIGTVLVIKNRKTIREQVTV